MSEVMNVGVMNVGQSTHYRAYNSMLIMGLLSCPHFYAEHGLRWIINGLATKNQEHGRYFLLPAIFTTPSTLLPWQAWTKKIFGFPARLGQRSAVNEVQS